MNDLLTKFTEERRARTELGELVSYLEKKNDELVGECEKLKQLVNDLLFSSKVWIHHTHLYSMLQARQQLLSSAIFYELKQIKNRPFSYSQNWTGTNLQLRLMRGVFSNANGLNPFLNPFLFSCMNTIAC